MTNISHSGLTMLCARNSGQQGKVARRLAAEECHAAAKDLFKHTGKDVRHLIPPVEDIIRDLATEARREVSQDAKTGKKFVNEFLTLFLSATVMLFVSTGSGRKLSASLAQPFLDELNQMLKTHKPSMLVYHRHDRIFRTKYLGANTLHLCEELDITLVDGEKGLLVGDFDGLMSMFRSQSSSDEAEHIPGKTRDGMTNRTGKAIEGTSVAYAVGQAAPAGMVVIRMKASTGLMGEGRLFFDAPSCHPPARLVAYGLPEVTLDGELVDQVALVRYALSHLGKPGGTITNVGRYLANQGFSTGKLRMHNDQSACFTPERVGNQFERVVRPIVARLDFYKTGRLDLDFGIAGVPNVAIDQCFPPDGPWATPEDFDRIAAMLAETRGGGPAAQGLTGVQIHTRAGAFPLRTAPKDRCNHGPSYILRPEESGGGKTGLTAIPHFALADSIVVALEAHASTLLTPLVQDDLPEATSLRQALRTAEAEAGRIEHMCAALLDQIVALDPEGKPLLAAHTQAALSKRHDRMVEDELTPALEKVKNHRIALEAFASEHLHRDSSVHDTLLLHMVASLRNPYNTTYNDLWKKSVTIDAIDREPVLVHETAGTITRWSGTIRIGGADQLFSAPLHGEVLDGAAAELPRKVDEAMAQMLEGTPFDQIRQTNSRGVRLAIAERYGFDSRYFGLPTCPHPRLVQIAAHLTIDASRDVARTAAVLGEELALVRDVLTQLTSGRPTWPTLVPRLDEITAA